MRPISAIALVQARLSSSRLPGKVLLPLGDGVVLDQVVARCRQFADQVVVCTSDDPSDDAIEQHCDRDGVLCVRGPLDDVFARFRGALADPRVAASDWFYRVTADCPLVSAELAQALAANATDEDDYLGIDSATAPLGTAVELVRRSAFEAIDLDDLDGPEREHVTLRLHENPDRYRCRRIAAPASHGAPELRLTLDYRADYAVLRELFAAVVDIDAAGAIRYLRRRPDLASQNRDLEQKSARACG